MIGPLLRALPGCQPRLNICRAQDSTEQRCCQSNTTRAEPAAGNHLGRTHVETLTHLADDPVSRQLVAVGAPGAQRSLL